MRKKRTGKERRYSGRVSGDSTLDYPKKEIIKNCLEPKEFYDEWQNYRDGFRGYDDHTKLQNENMVWSRQFKIKRWNEKIKKMIRLRKMKKSHKTKSLYI